jgi:ribonuclease HI
MGDSELVVRQVNGVYRVRDPTLVVYHHQVKSLYPLFEDVEVEVFPKAGPRKKRRYGNVAADALATETMNEGRDIYARSRQTA